MKKTVSLFVVLALVLGVALLGVKVNRANARGVPKVLEFETMVGVPRPYTGAANAIRGVPGGGLPWVIDLAEGELSVAGKLEVTVSGLVLDPNDATVISRGLAGVNPSAEFKAIVSCLSKDASGNPTVQNIATGSFPATATGDAKIEALVALPSPCIAPIIFVTSPTGAWFAATGQ